MAIVRVYKKADNGVIYTSPDPRFQGGYMVEVQRIAFEGDFVTGNVLTMKVAGEDITQNFDTDHATTMAALAAQIAAIPNVLRAEVTSSSIITVTTAIPEYNLPIEDILIEGGASQPDVGVTPDSDHELDLDDWEEPGWAEGMDYADIDVENIPESYSEAGNYHESIYFDGAAIEANLTVDTNWDVMLKPETLIYREYLARMRADLDAELARGTASSGTVTYGSPSNGDTLVVNGHTFTKVASSPGTDEFSSISELTDLIDALNDVGATDNGTVITITAEFTGVAGDEITLSKTGSALTLSGATLAGGVDPNAITVGRKQRAIDEMKEKIAMGHTANAYVSTRVDMEENPFGEYLDELALFMRQKDLENLNAGTDRPAYRTKLLAKIAEIEAAIAGR